MVGSAKSFAWDKQKQKRGYEINKYMEWHRHIHLPSCGYNVYRYICTKRAEHIQCVISKTHSAYNQQYRLHKNP